VPINEKFRSEIRAIELVNLRLYLQMTSENRDRNGRCLKRDMGPRKWS
jgi:hypothetical protein